MKETWEKIVAKGYGRTREVGLERSGPVLGCGKGERERANMEKKGENIEEELGQRGGSPERVRGFVFISQILFVLLLRF
jgi:hypothetical protein